MLQRHELVGRFGIYAVLSVLALAFSTASAGCAGDDSADDDDAGSGGTGSGGTGGGGSGGMNPNAVAWDATGWIEGTANPFMIQGAWYGYNDCMDAQAINLPCTQPDMMLMGPDGKPGWTAAVDKICTKGIATQVINDPATGMPAYSQQWGAGIAFDLNSSGGEPAVKNPFNAPAQGIIGFQFDITSNGAPPTVRVNFTSQATGVNAHFVEVTLPATAQQILLADALQGDWVMPQVPIPSDQLEAIQFQVYTNPTAAKPFDFCVSNMVVLK